MTAPPTTEKGHPGGIETSYVPGNGRTRYQTSSPSDWAPELHFPDSIVMYDAMRTESQLAGVLRAMAHPVIKANWALDDTGVPEDVMTLVATELGISTPARPLSRATHKGIRIIDHIRDMVPTLLWAGFSAAEQTYVGGPPLPTQEDLGRDQIIHLRKLSPRPPRTIAKIEVARDGGLVGIQQTPVEGTTYGNGIFIPVKQLVFYSLDREGGNWEGRSALRDAYRPWVMKDIYMRLDAQAVEKHAMGYWHGTTNDPARVDELTQTLAELRGGDRYAVVTPPGETATLLGMSGNLVDITPRLAFLNQEMSRSALAMFLDLGHDNGARSLGETHLAVFMGKVQDIANYVGDTITEHVIRDLVRFNFPDGTPYPSLVPGDVTTQQGLAADVLKTLMDSGAVTYDRGLEEQVRAANGIVPMLAEESEEEDTPDPEPEAPTVDAMMEAQELNARGNFVATMYRSGADFASAAKVAGLPHIEHLGLLPVTLQSEKAKEAEEAKAIDAAPDAENTVEDAPDQEQEETPTFVQARSSTAMEHADRIYQELVARVTGARA